jgi:hypothetical protein
LIGVTNEGSIQVTIGVVSGGAALLVAYAAFVIGLVPLPDAASIEPAKLHALALFLQPSVSSALRDQPALFLYEGCMYVQHEGINVSVQFCHDEGRFVGHQPAEGRLSARVLGDSPKEISNYSAGAAPIGPLVCQVPLTIGIRSWRACSTSATVSIAGFAFRICQRALRRYRPEDESGS